MIDKWIQVYGRGSSWSSEVAVFINPALEKAKIYTSKCIHLGCHSPDDSEYIEHTRIVSVEEAIKFVFPDEDAIEWILGITKNDYSELLTQLRNQGNDNRPKEYL